MSKVVAKKYLLMRRYLLLLLLSACAFALVVDDTSSKDKPAEDSKPIFSPNETAPLLTLQRDAVMAQADALPKQIYAEQATRRAQAAWAKLLKDKGIDATKWNCNEISFDCTPIPQPKEETKPTEKK